MNLYDSLALGSRQGKATSVTVLQILLSIKTELMIESLEFNAELSMAGACHVGPKILRPNLWIKSPRTVFL